MKKRLAGIINKLENYSISMPAWIISFFSIAFIRDFFEGALESSHTIGANPDIAYAFRQAFVLFNLEWLALFFGLVLVFYAFTGEKIEKLLKVTLFFYAWIIVVPFIDYFFYFPRGGRIDYFFTLAEYIKLLKYFFAFWVDINVTAGIRIEVLAGVMLSFSYVLLKTGSYLKSFGAALLVYFLAVSSMAFPVFSLLFYLPFAGKDFDPFIRLFYNSAPSPVLFIDRACVMIFLVLIPFLAAVYYLHDRKKASALFSSVFSRFQWVLFPALAAAGLLTALKTAGATAMPEYFKYSFGYFGLAAVSICGFLLWPVYTRARYKDKTFLLPSILLLLLCSQSISFHFLMVVLLCLSFIIFLKSRPFMLENTFPLNTAIEAALFFAVFFAGFTAATGAKAPQILQPSVFICLYLALFAFSAAKSLYTIPYDKKNKIWSVPVYFGVFWGKTIVTSACFMALLLLAFFLNTKTLIIPGIAAGFVSAFALNHPRLEKNGLEISCAALAGFLLIAPFLI